MKSESFQPPRMMGKREKRNDNSIFIILKGIWVFQKQTDVTINVYFLSLHFCLNTQFVKV